MDFQTRAYLERIVAIIMETFNIPTPIGNIDDVVAGMNGIIVELPEHPVGNTVAKGHGDCDFIIYVRKGQRREKRNLAIAQSLGILFLHMGYMTDWARWDSCDHTVYSGSYFQMDFEKDEFACDLLMPRQAFLDYIFQHSENGNVDTYRVSKHFGVPNGVAVKRGKWMGALQW